MICINKLLWYNIIIVERFIDMNEKEILIKIKNMSISFGQIRVLQNVNIDIYKGDFLYIIGPNGSGKSTFIKAITGLISPSVGSIDNYSNSMGYLPQKLNYRTNFPITVEEVIYSGFKKQSLFPDKLSRQIICQWLDKMEINDLINSPIVTLSGGEQQRVFFIRSLVNNPDVLILDEPTSALDPYFREKFHNIIKEVHNKGVTIIYVTHELAESLNPEARIIYVDREIKYDGSLQAYHAINHRSDSYV